MKPGFIVSSVLLCLGLAAPAAAQVNASLVTADSTVVAGQPFTVALHLVHREGWHTYWLNPGTGLATSIKWTLPPGWKASEIDWPAPQVIHDRQGAVTGNGYSGDVLLPVTITPAANASSGPAKLEAAVDWLMCQNVCEPGNATVALALTVGGSAIRDQEWGARIDATVAHLPRADAAWQTAATRTGKSVTLRLSPAKGAGAPVALRELHFFSDDNFIGYELPQQVDADGQGGFVLTLQISPDGPQDDKSLRGVLTGTPTWSLRVDTPFGSGAAASGAPASGGGAALSGPGAPAAPAGGLGATLVLAFFGGMILNLMPCVFPVLGIKILGFVNQAGTDRRKVVAHGLIFTAGVLLSFWLLAAVLTVLRRGGAQLGWGFQLQSPAFIFGLAAAMLVFALNLSGVFEFGLSATAIGGSLQSRSGFTGSFFTGVLATVVATPCSAPFLAPALGAALTLSLLQSWTVFTVIALGLCTPYLLLSIFPAAVKVLPRPGAWMETFKQFMAFPLYATVGYLVWVLAGQIPDSEFLNALFGLVIVALAIWLYGRYHAPGASSGRARFGLMGGLLLVAVGAWTGWPTAPRPDAITWEKWSPEAVDKLRAEGRIVYVDFTARWCATCQANKKVVFHSDEVLRAFRDRKVATLRGDWTNQDPAITAELQKYHRSAVPFNQVWLPAQPDPVLLPEILTPGVVLRAVGQKNG